MKYGVFEISGSTEPNGKPCSIEGFPHMDKYWANHLFNTFEQALLYAEEWCGKFWRGDIRLNERVDISGFGDYIQIRECLPEPSRTIEGNDA